MLFRSFSLSRPLLLRSTGSRRVGSVVVAHGPRCSAACGIFPDQGSNPCPLRWQADSQPLRHQGSPGSQQFEKKVQRAPHILLAPSYHSLPPLSTSPPDGTFVTADGPTWAHHHHPKTEFIPGFTLGVVHSVGLASTQCHVSTIIASHRV